MSAIEDRAWNRMEFIYTNDEMSRFTFSSPSETTLFIQVDLHNLSCFEARRLLNNLMLLVQDQFELLIIHGYRHGQALKDMLWFDYENQRLAGRYDIDYNPGETLFKVA